MNHDPALSPEGAIQSWIDAFNAARDAPAIAALFAEDGHWRDLLALTWRLQTLSGRDTVAAALAANRPRNLRIAPGRSPPHHALRAGRDVIEAFLTLETDNGPTIAVLRLLPEGAWIFLTALDAIAGHPEFQDRTDYNREFGADNWLDKRIKAQAYAEHEPAVLVVGAGQAGLAAAARLTQLGVDTLVIDRNARIGDNWRNRYHALTLHNEVHVNHLPYLPFPPTWPMFIPKDKLANWFEFYADAMELNVWTGTALQTASYDEASATWTVTLERDGITRILRPRHIVFATGVSSIPIRPNLPGLDNFAGPILHSGDYTDGHAWKGKHTLVVGTGNSGHDVAQDLHASGAHVTMVQRNPTYIVSLAEAQRVYSIYAEGMPTDDCDLLATANPFPVLEEAYRRATEISRQADAALLHALENAGFRLDMAPGHMGFQMLYLQRGGGYYFNVGCSDLIASGDIALAQYNDIATFTAAGARLKSGETLPADLIVLATGYKNQQDTARAFLGDTVADRIGPVWGFDEGGELRNMWRETPQPGLWFTAGSLAQCRIYSKVLALQIKARELGIVG